MFRAASALAETRRDTGSVPSRSTEGEDLTRHIGLRLLLVVAVTFPMLAFPASVFAAQTCRYVNYTVSYKIASNANLYSTTGWVKLKKYFCVENGEFTQHRAPSLPDVEGRAAGRTQDEAPQQGRRAPEP